MTPYNFMYDSLAHLEEDDYLGAAGRTLVDKWQKSVMYGLIKVGEFALKPSLSVKILHRCST